MTRAEIDAELWRPVPGYEGLYDVSDLGRVRSIRSGKTLSSKPKAGVRAVTLCERGMGHSVAIHTLVLKAFLGPPEKGQVCHRVDADMANNRLGNLSWGSLPRGSKRAAAKLTEAQIPAIRSDTRSLRIVAAEHGVSQGAIRQVLDGVTWRHVPWD